MLHPSYSLSRSICQLLLQHDLAHQAPELQHLLELLSVRYSFVLGSLAVPVTVDFCCVVGEMLSINKRGTAWLDA